MNNNPGRNRISRKNAQPLAEVLRQYLGSRGLAKGMSTHLVFSAWDNASGAGPYTVRKFFRDGKLYITLSSSVVRSQLGFQRKELVDKMNALLKADELFPGKTGEGNYIKELILK